ncbi:MAG: aromatic ring-hydroxylating dioxygenase subunit alpha [Proteobacteria bacterium]|nr:aromatic ring-hydroxylating dioxygenase subunit alpha [Pseudomonadota bacterium]
MSQTQQDAVAKRLEEGLKDRWYALCPSSFVKEKPVSLQRLGTHLAVWRGTDGKVHALEDRCPHRGAKLSQGTILNDTLKCPYHGVEVRCDGVATSVPASPGCKLEGSHSTFNYHVAEVADTLFVYNASKPVDTPPPLTLPPELADDAQFSRFLCYVEWKCDYRYVLDNVLDPMHGTFLHKQSHAMSQGATQSKFGIEATDTGFLFAKEGQRDVNFDWSEFADTGIQWVKLEIPYPKTGGPGGGFIIIGMVTPISHELCGVYFWRVRKVAPGWQRDTWRFLYRDRLEARHWHVLEQDRVLLEDLAPNANDPKHEHLYDHDMGVVRLRRVMRSLAQEQIEAEKATA